MALLTPDPEIIDVNDEFAAAVGSSVEDIVGHHAFEKFPKMPEDPGGDPKWTALEAALTSGQHEVLKLTRYDIEDPGHPGVFSERYWSSAVTPIRNDRGEIEMLELSAREVTAIIDQYRSLEADQH